MTPERPAVTEIKWLFFSCWTSPTIFVVMQTGTLGSQFTRSSEEHQGLATTSASARRPESSSHRGIPSIRVIYERADRGYYTWIKSRRAGLRAEARLHVDCMTKNRSVHEYLTANLILTVSICSDWPFISHDGLQLAFLSVLSNIFQKWSSCSCCSPPEDRSQAPPTEPRDWGTDNVIFEYISAVW